MCATIPQIQKDFWMSNSESEEMYTPTNEQKLIDIMFSVGIMIHEHRTVFEGKSRKEVAAWIAEQLEHCGFKTIPLDHSWGALVEIN